MMDASKSMFEITDEDIAQLDDKDLRSLVGLLCEAELRSSGLPTSYVRWGGNQNARDGGLDVVVDVPPEHSMQGFIPRNFTGIQVKKSGMQRYAITSEMQPKGSLRPVIAELAQCAGAYIILSGAASTSASLLKERRATMAEALGDCPDAGKLTLDFYDSSHVANWVRNHSGVTIWVREKIGKPLKGWRSCYPEAWINYKRITKYVPEDQIPLHKDDQGRTLSTVSVINEIRKRLSTPACAVRLLGLSGVGKTRLVQALFDKDVGVHSVDPAVAIYADHSDVPDPHPLELATRLQAEKRPAVLIVDNCPVDLHQRLAEFVRSANSTLSLITVEHDIRDGDTEASDYFLLNPSHHSVIEQLVAEYSPKLSDINIHRICTFAGGNARIALMLAEHADRANHIATFSNDYLLRKIVLQNENDNVELLTVAKVCSLVYSFNGEDDEQGENHSEVRSLAKLADLSLSRFRSNVANLKRRNIIQQRGPWRALLPQAIANRLAAQALEEISSHDLLAHLVTGKPTRLAQSFARRLGYLDRHEPAKAIAKQWLSPGGLLAEPAVLSPEQIDMLFSVAPLDQERTFALIEKAILAGDSTLLNREYDLGLLLHFLAREPENFERALNILVRLLERGGAELERNSTAEVISSLFSMAWSGTHASISARTRAVSKLLNAEEQHVREAGCLALKSMLESRYFKVIGSYFSGGSLYEAGFVPESPEEVVVWLSTVLEFVTPIALSITDPGAAVRNVVAEQSHNLWLIDPVSTTLDTLYRDIAASRFWPEGLRAVQKTLGEADERFTPELLAQLSELETVLSPRKLVDRVTVILAPIGISEAAFGKMEEATLQRYIDSLRSTAKELLATPEILSELLPALVNDVEGAGMLGAALAAHASDPLLLWREVLANFSPEQSNIHFIRDFIRATEEKDQRLSETLIDEVTQFPQLNDSLPLIYGIVRLTERTMPRLHAALTISSIKEFEFFGFSKFYKVIDFNELNDFIRSLLVLPGGAPIALKLVSLRVLNDPSETTVEDAAQWAPTIRDILAICPLPKDKGSFLPQNIGGLVEIALGEDEGLGIVQRLSRALLDHVRARSPHILEYGDLLEALLQVQPVTVLETFCCTDSQTTLRAQAMLQDFRTVDRDVFRRASLPTLFAWFNAEPNVRYPLIASLIHPIRRTLSDASLEWSAFATQLLATAPDAEKVLEELLNAVDEIYVSWHRRKEALELKLKLIKQLDFARLHSVAKYIQKIEKIKSAIESTEEEELVFRGFE